MSELRQALLAAVPVDGSSIGNQSLLERLKNQFEQLTEEAYLEARDALIAQGVLLKGRGRGGSVMRAEAQEQSLAEQALRKARQRQETLELEEPSEPKAKPARVPAKIKAATGIEDMKKTLWAAADKLRANMDAAEYKHIVLGLIFLKYISDSFAGLREQLTRRFLDENDEYYLGDDDAEILAGELEERDYYKAENVFWVPEAARWEGLRAAAKQADIGKRIDEALAAIEAENPSLKNILNKRYARAQLPDGKLGELVDLVATIGFGDDASKARDLLGQVYEYFLGQFASAEGKKGGQFYTPASIVKTLVAVLNPHHGKVYDPCCGSGGMFVQSEKFIEAHGGKLGDVSIYGQESNPYHLAPGGDEPGHSRHRFQPRQGAGGHLRAQPAPGSARRLHPRQPAVQHQRLVARQPGRRPALGLRHSAARQRQLRLVAAHALPAQAQRSRRHRAG